MNSNSDNLVNHHPETSSSLNSFFSAESQITKTKNSSQSYLVFARKYRPQNFIDLVGQDILVKTLGNAINKNKLHHAFILTGIRGIGKTTTARIIAKTINCQNLNIINELPICCNQCASCIAINKANHPDVFEIDAASNTGVDDARKIIESIAYATSMSRYKVYIIDEFHMLSKNAFNALLKTLEEPPSHVKFIFATTEINKTPNTILSRCQKFHLRSLSEEELAKHLQNILHQEEMTADDMVFTAIARFAEGSVRDALSFLDQAVATNNFVNFLPFAIVEKMFLSQDPLSILAIIDNAITGNYSTVLQLFNNYYQYSQNLRLLTIDLLTAISDLINAKLINNYQTKSLSQNYQQEIINLSSKVSLPNLLNLWQIIQRSWLEIKDSPVAKISYEIMLAKICFIITAPNLEEILASIDNRKEFANNDLQNLSLQTQDLTAFASANFANAKIIVD